MKRKITRYWYEVRYSYKNKQNHELFNFTKSIGLKRRSDILNRRYVKQITVNMEDFKAAKRLLCNGLLGFDILCYIGKFRT
jgi:hypothetical protein